MRRPLFQAWEGCRKQRSGWTFFRDGVWEVGQVPDDVIAADWRSTRMEKRINRKFILR